jgi:ribosomal protein S12 methylthiotransferase accessory factor
MTIGFSYSCEKLFLTLDTLVDERVGIIRGLSEIPNQPGLPDFFHYVAEACDTSAFSNRKNFAVSGGVSSNRAVAMAKAIGEAVERYCCTFYDQQHLPLASSSSAQFTTVDPENFALFTPTQYSQPNFRYVPFTRETPIRWTEAKELYTGASMYVPACMVYMPYRFDRDVGEQPICQPISTGLACHCSWEEAVVSAICEVVERDAFTITWQAMLPVPSIRLESLSDRNQELVERFQRAGGSVRMLDITLDHGVPCILTVLTSDEPRAPALVVAASCAVNPEDAARKSLEELAHTHRAAMEFRATSPPFVPEPEYANVTDQKAHFRLYTQHGYQHLAHFLFSSNHSIDFGALPDISDSAPEQALRNLVGVIAKNNHKVLVTELTTDDVKQLGLSVARAIIPGFHPLFMGHYNRALGGTRLWSIPQALGYRGVTDTDNPAPHPYP